jgi:hypothetical protein
MEAKHPWQARLAVGIIMLVLAFLGMVVTDVKSTGGFDYWKWMVPVYALLALWLSWYVRRQTQTLSPITLWHEVLHWVGLFLSVFMVAYLVDLGTLSRFLAGIFDLTLLALAVFLAGIYIETTFLFIGIVLGVFAMLAAILIEYLYAILIPILLAGAVITALVVYLSHKKFTKTK